MGHAADVILSYKGIVVDSKLEKIRKDFAEGMASEQKKVEDNQEKMRGRALAMLQLPEGEGNPRVLSSNPSDAASAHPPLAELPEEM